MRKTRRKRTTARGVARADPARASPCSDDMDMAKVARLRALVEAGKLGMDFDMLVERLVHAMQA
jgi:anti-sigma28 factor (negative regulator of flagellin synthesis)